MRGDRGGRGVLVGGGDNDARYDGGIEGGGEEVDGEDAGGDAEEAPSAVQLGAAGCEVRKWRVWGTVGQRGCRC